MRAEVSLYTHRKFALVASLLPADVVDDVEADERGEGQSEHDGDRIGVEGEAMLAGKSGCRKFGYIDTRGHWGSCKCGSDVGDLDSESRKPTLRFGSRCVGALEPEAKFGGFV